MLTHTTMGLLALGILWVNTLLVVGAALKVLGNIMARHGEAKTALVGTVVSDDIARHVVEQVGRKASDDADRKAILFHDRAFRSEIAGGTVAISDEELTLEGDGEVWLGNDERREAALRDRPPFEEAYQSASKAKGFVRNVTARVERGANVWIIAQRSGDVLGPTAAGTLVISTLDPAAWCRRKALLLVAFVIAMVALAAGCTLLALYPPVFGTISMIGGAAGLAFFLLVQPAGVMARDAVLFPNCAHVRGSWIDEDSEGRGGPAPGDEVYAD